MIFPSKEVCEVVPVENEDDILSLVKGYDQKLIVIPDKGSAEKPYVKSTAGDFAKWLQKNNPQIDIALPKEAAKLQLRSNEIWLPLVFLSQDVALPIYLNIVCSYLYDKMKGALKGDVARVDLSVVFKDEKKGVLKKFNFSGDAETLQKTIKKMDLNQFFDE